MQFTISHDYAFYTTITISTWRRSQQIHTNQSDMTDFDFATMLLQSQYERT